jgi:hypothetical protein
MTLSRVAAASLVEAAAARTAVARPSLLLSKHSHVSCVAGQRLHESKGKRVLGNPERTRETQVNLFFF